MRRGWSRAAAKGENGDFDITSGHAAPTSSMEPFVLCPPRLVVSHLAVRACSILLNGSRRPALLIDRSAFLPRRIITVTTWSAVDPDVKAGSAPRTPGVELQGRFAAGF